MTQVMIDRELLERLLYSNSPARFDATEYNAARAELFAIIANPTQQGEAVEVVPDGYVVVPVEPTPEMAAQTAYDGKQYSDPFDFDDFRKDYAAMLAAAPAQDVAGWIPLQALYAKPAASVPAGCLVVPVELLERLETWVTDDCSALEELRALLASAEGVKDE